MHRPKLFVLAMALVIAFLQVLVAERAAAAATLNGHQVVSDASGKIIPWTGDPAAGYGAVIDNAWGYLLNKVPNDPSTGKPAYYTQSYLNPDTQQMAGWPHNPAGLYSMLVESALKYYAYSGDIRPVQLAQQVASWQITNGMTEATDNWARVPYSSGDAGSLTYQGASYGNATGVGDGTGYLQPDKVGAMGYAWAQLYQFDGNTTYRDAAISAADALVKHLRPGNATQSPWPFRVNAATGSVREQYTANVIDPIQLFDTLIALGVGDTAAYRSARQAAWTWLMTYPMTNNTWANYFEDVPVQSNLDNDNQLIPMMTARYLLLHQDSDPNWRSHVQGLIAWVEQNFGAQDSGATIIKEQNAFAFAMGSHTSRYASVNALYSAATGDLTAKTKAYYSLNWASYMTRDSGVVIDGPQVNNQWFTDGYGDYIRHFLTGMQAFPEWAPPGQNHLTGSTSLVKAVTYSGSSMSYTTADAASIESLRLTFRPTQVTAGGRSLTLRSDLAQEGWTYDAGTGVVRVRHDSGAAVQITATGGSGAGSTANAAPTVTLSAPIDGTAVTVGSSVQLAASAADTDGSVTSVQFLAGGQQVATVAVAPYTYRWTPASPGTYVIVAVATDDDGAGTRSAPVTITVSPATPVARSWQASDIGSVGVAGDWSNADGTFTVIGSGVDIWDAADSFRFVYQPLVGDGQVTARVDAQGNTDPWALSGVMIREDLSPSSRHAIVAVTPAHGLSLTSRAQPGAPSQYLDGGAAAPPRWIRLTRSGTQFSAAESGDGSQWATVGTVTIPMGTSAYAGLAVTSHDNSVTMTSTFGKVSVTGAGDTVAPVISSVAVGAANQNGASVTWTTDEPSDSQIEYGTSTAYGSATALNSSLVTGHAMVVSGLDPDTTYHFRVKSRDAAGNLTIGTDAVFATPAAANATVDPGPTTTSPPTPLPTTSTSATSTATNPTSTTTPTPASDAVSLRSRANLKYVTVDNAGDSVLIANGTSIGRSETFDMINLGADKVALRAHANNLYVTADNDGTSALIANRNAIGPGETFTLIRNVDGTESLEAQANGRYVAAENAGASPLVANRAAIRLWEKFDLIEN